MTIVASNSGWLTSSTVPTSWASTPTQGNTVICRAVVNATLATISTPSGWTLVADQPHDANDYIHQYIWAKTAGPAESAPSLAISQSAICGWDLLELDAQYDITASAPEFSAASGATVDFPAATVTEASMVIHHGFHKMGGTTVGAFTPGTGLLVGDEVIDDTRPGGHGALVVYMTDETSSTSARDCTYTGSAANHWVGSSIVAAPATVGGGGGGTPTHTLGTINTDDSETGSSQATATIPTHATDDLLVLYVAADDGGSVSFTDPSGWTKLGEQGGNGSIIGVWSKVATSSSETDPVVGLGAPEDYVAAVANLGDTEIDQSSFAASNTAPSVTTTVDNCRIIRFAGSNNSGTHSWSGATEIAEQSSPTGGVVVASWASDELTSAGSAGTATVTPTSGDTANTVTIAYAAVGAEPVTPPVPETTGTNTDGTHWVAAKVTVSGVPSWVTAEFTLANGTVVTPPPATGLLVPTYSTIREAFGVYNGNNVIYSRDNATSLGIGASERVGVHYMAAPSDNPINVAASLVSNYVNRDLLTDPTQWALFSIHTFDDSVRPSGRPDSNATAQAEAYAEVTAGTHDAQLVKIGQALRRAIEGGVPYIFIQVPGQELNGDWQGQAPFAANIAAWQAMTKHAIDTIYGELTAAQMEKVFTDFSLSKNTTRDCNPDDFYIDEVSAVKGRDYYDTMSVNVYLDKAPGAAAHITPAGPFGPTNVSNKLTAQGRTELWARVHDRTWGLADIAAFAASKGKPLGMGEGGPGTGTHSETAPLKAAAWCHDDPDMTDFWATWWQTNSAESDLGCPFWMIFNSTSGGVGVKFSGLPDSWARLRTVLGRY